MGAAVPHGEGAGRPGEGAGEGAGKAQQRLETRARLVTVAREMFSRDGYAAVSLAQIAEGPV
jgi:AcrR family transcriptional regulator